MTDSAQVDGRPLEEVRQFAIYSSLYAGASLAQKGLIMLLMLWLARVLSTEQYAVFGLLYAVQTGLTALSMAGIVEQVVTRRHQAAELGSSLGSHRVNQQLFLVQALGLSLLALGVIVCIPSGSSVALHEVLWALAGGGITGLALLAAGLARLDHDHRASLILGAGVPALGTLGAWLAVIWSPDSGAFFIGYAVGSGVALGLARRLLPSKAKSQESNTVGQGFRESLPYLVVGVMLWISGYGNLWLIDQWFLSETVAQYTLAFTLASVIQIAANAMNQVWAPRHYDFLRTLPARAVEARCRRYYLIVGLVVSAVAVAVFLALPLALEIGGGNLSSYVAIRPGLLWLFAGYALSIPWWHAQNLFVVHGAGNALMRVLGWSTVLGVVLWIAAMQWLGVLGLYLGYALIMAIRSLAVWWVAFREWGTELRWEGVLLACLILSICGVMS